MQYNQIVRSKDGAHRHIQDVNDVQIPDLWHAAMAIKDGRRLSEQDAELVLETWALCHDLLKHIKRVCAEPNSNSPVSLTASICRHPLKAIEHKAATCSGPWAIWAAIDLSLAYC